MKKALIAVAILLAIGAIGAYLVFNYLDLIVKTALERYGPDVTGVPVKVAEVRISPRDGRGVIRALEIGNPKGFSAKHAARFGEIRLALEPATITEKVIHVRELTIDSPQITYERGQKVTNLDVIQANIEAYVKKATGEDEARGRQGRGEKRRFVIDRLTIRGGRVLMTNPGLRGQGLNFDLPEIQLRDVGKSRGGATASEVASQVAGTLQNRIAQKVLTNIEALRKGGLEGAVDALKGLLK